MQSGLGRNDMCACKSGLKYKHCYLANNSDCILFKDKQITEMEKLHEEHVQETLKILLSITGELAQLFHLDKNGIQVVPVRMQLIGIFTIVDVIAHYYNEYGGESLTQSVRFINFVERFCFVDENKEYASRKYLGDMSVNELYSLRNGLVHFYGLAEAKYCILPNLSKVFTQEIVDNAYNDFTELSKIQGKDLCFVQPSELRMVVVEGVVLVLKYFSQMEADSTKSKEKRLAHLSGMERIFKKLEKEGASVVDQNLANRLNEKLSQERKH
ncbi:MAG: SEC-C metal-binding domain-containing protein [bacterium]